MEALFRDYAIRANPHVGSDGDPDVQRILKKAERRLRFIRGRWQNHLKLFFGRIRATSLSTDDINRYVQERQREASNATINRELALPAVLVRSSRKTSSSECGAQHDSAWSSNPPSAQEQMLMDYFQTRMDARMGRRTPMVTSRDLAALRRLLRLYRNDGTVTIELLKRCIDNACASWEFPFKRKAFSLKEFCAVSPFHRFADEAQSTHINPTDSGKPRDWKKKTVAQTVADGGHNYFQEIQRVSALSPEYEDAETEKWWLEEHVQKGLSEFCSYTGWRFEEVDKSEVDLRFVEILGEQYWKHCDDHPKPLSPGNLMSRCIDVAIERRVPWPPAFGEYRTKIRAAEKEHSQAK
jgi:hypothetical protein